MRVALVGAGNVAYSLGFALQKAGHGLVQIISRNHTHAESLALKMGVLCYSDNLGDLVEADILILCVADSALAQVAGRCSEVLNGRIGVRDGSLPLMLHTAGSMPLETIPYARRGVLYPMQTFTKEYVADFTHLPLFIEADTTAVQEELEGFARSLSDQVFLLSSADRKYLHLAAVFCCNFANHCMVMGADILERHNIPFKVMLPLIEGMTKKLYDLPARQAQSGPAFRGDYNVMENQRGLLLSDNRVDLAFVYETLSSSIQKYRDYDK